MIRKLEHLQPVLQVVSVTGFYSENFLFAPQLIQQTAPQYSRLYKKKNPSLCVFQWLPVNSKTPSTAAINVHNKCNSKYTMRSVIRMQVLELSSFRCGKFCTRTTRKATIVRIFLILDYLSKSNVNRTWLTV
jgi:hypothetical protein